MITFPLPCKKYVKHYLERCFGSPVILREESNIGKYFFRIITEPTQENDKKAGKGQWRDAECLIEIKQRLMLRTGYVLTPSDVVKFNCFVEEHFWEQVDLIFEIMVEKNKTKITDAIEFVYDKFGMDESVLDKETIKKHYQRYRDRPKVA